MKEVTTKTTYTCDRCGKKAELLEVGGLSTVDSWEEDTRHALADPGPPAGFDLCDACAGLLDDFMAGRAVPAL